MNYLKKSLRCLFFILPFFAVSCISPLDQTDIYNQTKSEKTVLVTGSIAPELQGAFPKEIIDGLTNNANVAGKTAYPTIGSSASFIYEIIADKYDENNTVTETKNFKISGDSNPSAVTGQTKSYAIALPFGKWKLTAKVYLYVAATPGSTNYNYYDPTKKIMEGTTSNFITINESTPGVSVGQPITVQPVMSESGTGYISLDVSVDNTDYSDDKKINYIQYKAIEDSSITPSARAQINSLSGKGRLTTQDSEAKKSGTYTFELNFYNSETSTELLYQCYEKVNVYDNLTTNAWCGNADYFYEDNSGTTQFKITKECREKFNKSIFYVKQDEIVDDLASGYSDEGNGSISSPYKSLKSAINKINSQSKGKYTIFINGDIKLLRTSNSGDGLYYSEITNNSDITIIGTDSSWVPLTDSNKIEISVYKDATTKYGDEESPNMGFIKTNGNLTLKNIKFNNFGSLTKQHNAIWLNGDENNKKTFNALYCEFVNCKSYSNQLGAISSSYFNNIIDKCIFDSCKAINTGTSTHSMGGAINLCSSDCKINDTIFTKCSATRGAAIYADKATGDTSIYNLEISGNCIFGDESILPLDNVPSTSGNTASEGIVYVNDMNCTITGNVKFIGNYITQSSVLYIDATSNINVNIGNQGANNNSSPIFQYNKVDQTSEGESFNAGIITVEGKCNFNFYSGKILNNNIKISTNFNKKAATALHESDNTSANDLNYYGGIIKDNIISNEGSSIFDTTLITAGILNSNKGSTLKLGNVIFKDNKYSGNEIVIPCDIAIHKDNANTFMEFIKDYKGSEKINIVVKNYNSLMNRYLDTNSQFITLNGNQKNKDNCGFLESSIIGRYVDCTGDSGVIKERNIEASRDICTFDDSEYESIPETVYVYDQKGLETISNFCTYYSGSTPSARKNFYNKTIVLNNNILVTDLKMIGNISDSNNCFAGTFDGNEKTITIKSVNSGCNAIFGRATDGTIKDLTLDGDFTVNDSFYSFADGCDTIENCTNNCNITCTGSNKTITGFCNTMTSGLDGYKNCKNTGNLTCKNGNVYGIASETSGLSPAIYIKDSSNTGNLTGKNVAGIIGKFCGLIINCSNTGTLEGENVGGIARQYYSYAHTNWNSKNYNQIPTQTNGYIGTGILNCYNNGDINYTGGSSGYAGGIVGMAEIENEVFGKVIIQNCVNYKAINGSGTKGGIIGKISGATEDDCQLFKYNYYHNANSSAIGNEIGINESTSILLSFETTVNSPGQLINSVSLGSNPVNNYYTAVNNWIQYIGGATEYSFYKQWVAETAVQVIPYIF